MDAATVEAIKGRIRAYSEDMVLFINECVSIKTKDSKVVRLKLNGAQRELYYGTRNARFTHVLKSRQLGVSTIFHVETLYHTMFAKNHRTALVYQGDAAAKAALATIKDIFRMLPSWTNLVSAWNIVEDNAHTFALANGSVIKAFTANSEGIRSTNFNRIHCSEVAFWDSLNTSIGAIYPLIGEDSTFIMESTANGPNDFYTRWLNAGNNDTKLFVNWVMDENAVSRHAPKPETLELLKKEYFKDSGVTLTQAQTNWIADKLQGLDCDIHKLKQEYPLTPDDAFLLSGTKVFSRIFPVTKESEGLHTYGEKSTLGHYSIGVDVATGAPDGDYTAFVVLDISTKGKPEIVETYYRRVHINDVVPVLLARAKHWNNAKLNIETNIGEGRSLQESLFQADYNNYYYQTLYDGTGNRVGDKPGFQTTSTSRPTLIRHLINFISNKSNRIPCPNMQLEINNFIYNKNGRAEAQSGRHDDMLIALALALECETQVSRFTKEEDVIAKYEAAVYERRFPGMELTFAYEEAKKEKDEDWFTW